MNQYTQITDAGANRKFYRITIDQSSFNNSTSGTAGGGCSPVTNEDFIEDGSTASKATSLVLARRRVRGNLRWKLILQKLSIYGNINVLSVDVDSELPTQTVSADHQSSTVTFTVELENETAWPTSGTSVDGSTALATRTAILKDLVQSALDATHTARARVFFFEGGGSDGSELTERDEDITVTAVDPTGEIGEAITVAEISNTNQA